MIKVYFSVSEKFRENGSAAARKLLNCALGRDFGLSAALLKDERGKPYLRDHPELCVSITHTDGVVAVVLSDSPVGIDVQTVGAPRPRIIKSLFGEREAKYVGTDPRRFAEIWTRKESLAKYTGEGITRALSETDVLSGVAGVNFIPLEIGGTVACVCSAQREASLIFIAESDVYTEE